jgi:MoaA/NifB/PqqE/SkfB family radical SAM enzyme
VSTSPLRHAGSALWKRRPIHLTLFLTRRCNARCGFCFSRAIPEGAGPELSAEEIARVAGSCGSLLWLSFSGGEVFLRDDLPAVVAAAARGTRPAIILLPTNGLLPERVREATAEILATCRESTVVVKISLDGPPALHDRLRGVPGAFDRALETHRGLAGLARRFPRLELGVNTVFCAANQGAMAETARIVSGLDGVRTHTVSLVRGALPDPALGVVDEELYELVAEELARGLRSGAQPVYRFRGARVKAAQDIVQRRLIRRTAAERRQVIPCHAGRLNLVVTATGELHPCENFGLRLGNVRDHGCDVAAACRTPEAAAVLAGIRRGECWCTHECFMMTNILFSLRCWPALGREYLRLLPKPRSRG